MESSKNIYRDEINFATLASHDADFAKILKPNGQVDFSDPASIQQLTKSLLKRDFGLQITLPPDRLCPPVPNRLNYLLWIQDLLDTTSDSFSDRHDPKREVVGLDIGTGASCIYPLLGCAQWPKWRFAATDIDEKSLEYAQQNIQSNGLEKRIKLLKSSPEASLIPLDTLGLEDIDFTMCNPPFYTSTGDLLTSASLKSRPPFSACTGSSSEMVTPGGETTFVGHMVSTSTSLRERVQWYSSMLGKYSSVSVIVEQLKKAGVTNYAVTEFVQGSKTRRWAVAWSWADMRPAMRVARGVPSLPKVLLPFPSEYVLSVSGELDALVKRLNATMASLQVQWQWKASLSTGVGFAARNVWSRAARRGAVKDHGSASAFASTDAAEESEEDEMAFGFKVRVQKTAAEEDAIEILIRWLKGNDSVLFESFCGMVKRKLEG